ncbi:hypothetical protein [Piscirickettsia litoralis]|uniref:MFS transporter n=1 Tax=Piscirickettsia litoralis TaxID=1891921 RepID=A0ABX3A4P6_9GAMM|nr:hypothetical protein [Piscirickettsia litoralis]ODN43828.1 hypothetical protein BGC07_14150 [Piscirickettsia litoralis]
MFENQANLTEEIGHFSLMAYQQALWVVPVVILLSVVLSLFIKENYMNHDSLIGVKHDEI